MILPTKQGQIKISEEQTDKPIEYQNKPIVEEYPIFVYA
jgi:hypothetical protein